MTLRSSSSEAAYSDNGSLEPAVISEQERPATVHDLSLETVPAEGVAAPPSAGVPAEQAVLPAIQTQSLSEVYEQAGVHVPAHGFSILKIADMLSSAHVRDLAPEAKRAAVMMALEASNIQLNEVIEDAARRERALNDYEARQQQTFQNYKAGMQQHNEEIQAEVQRLTELLRLKIQENEKELASEKSRLDEWRTRKREEERRIRSAVTHFGGTGVAAHQANGEMASAPVSSQRSQPEKPIDGSDHAPAASPAAENGGRPATVRSSLWKRDKDK